jgi:hypothetical protein
MEILISAVIILFLIVVAVVINRSRQTREKIEIGEELAKKGRIGRSSGSVNYDAPVAHPSAPPPPVPAAEPEPQPQAPPQPKTTAGKRGVQLEDIGDEGVLYGKQDPLESGASDRDEEEDFILGGTEASSEIAASEPNELAASREKSKAKEEREEEETPSIDDLVDDRQTLLPEQTKTAQFSAYYPRETQAKTRHGLYVYAHTPDAIKVMNRDVQKFEQELGGEIPRPMTTKQSTKIKQGTLITIVPECDEIEFSPPSLTKKWDDEWVRYDFDFKASDDLLGETLFIRVSVQIASIEIAHIKCATEIVETTKTPVNTSKKPENPLAAAKLGSQIGKQTANMYDKIFISYSRKDTKVAAAYRLAQMAAGHDVFMDTESIHTGEDWKVALAKAIDEADMFQLFWSQHSADSDNVRHEWDYALQYKCADDACVGFIRPVYWQKPMPTPPGELGHLNFRFVPLQDAK